MQRALNAKRSKAGREGSLVKEDMIGLRRRRMVKSRDSGLVNLRIRNQCGLSGMSETGRVVRRSWRQWQGPPK